MKKQSIWLTIHTIPANHVAGGRGGEEIGMWLLVVLVIVALASMKLGAELLKECWREMCIYLSFSRTDDSCFKTCDLGNIVSVREQEHLPGLTRSLLGFEVILGEKTDTEDVESQHSLSESFEAAFLGSAPTNNSLGSAPAN